MRSLPKSLSGLTINSLACRRGSLAALAWSVTAWHAAQAQTIGHLIEEPKDVPGQRTLPEYSPIGYDLEGFFIFPTVAFGAYGDNNVFSRSSVKRGDVALIVEPRLRGRREDRKQAVTFDLGAKTSSYLKLSNQSAAGYHLEGTYTRGTTTPNSLTLNAGYRREAIQRGTVENDLADGEPLLRRVAQASVTGRKRFNRLYVDAQALFVEQRYENVESPTGIVNQKFRNVSRYGLHGVASFDVSSRTAIFTGVEYDKFDYVRVSGLIDRDADNASITAGLRYEVTRVLYAQASVGYRRYDFKDPALGNVTGVAVSAHLRYFPTRLLAFRGIVEQSNTTSPYDLVGAVTLTTAKLDVEYEMRRSISWLSSMKFTLEDYAKQTYSARRLEVNAGPRLRLNRWLSVDITGGYARRFVNGVAPFEKYSQVYGLVSVVLAR